MDIRLDGRAALITGGSEGLGKGMAIKFAGSGAAGHITGTAINVDGGRSPVVQVSVRKFNATHPI